MNVLARAIDGMQELLAVCPCCGEIFRLVEGKFVFPEKRPEPCEYFELYGFERRLDKEEQRLSSAEERFEERLKAQRQKLTDLGRKKAKRKLRRIDPTFSAKNIDPQDVKVIFDPVEYVIFHGLNSDYEVGLVEFVSRVPQNTRQESTAKSIERAIERAIRSGNVDFETLRLKDDGSFEIHKQVGSE